MMYSLRPNHPPPFNPLLKPKLCLQLGHVELTLQYVTWWHRLVGWSAGFLGEAESDCTKQFRIAFEW